MASPRSSLRSTVKRSPPLSRSRVQIPLSQLLLSPFLKSLNQLSSNAGYKLLCQRVVNWIRKVIFHPQRNRCCRVTLLRCQRPSSIQMLKQWMSRSLCLFVSSRVVRYDCDRGVLNTIYSRRKWFRPSTPADLQIRLDWRTCVVTFCDDTTGAEGEELTVWTDVCYKGI